MASTYANDFVGIAVHNNDPMAFAEYDTPFGEYIEDTQVFLSTERMKWIQKIYLLFEQYG
ncbi:MAG: hypothetical protein IPF52_03160 [Saprospiraceae bacterium]|nr:hypothetical protein [Saprospiraceae bacterium]